MGRGRNRLYFGASFLVSFIPALAGMYCIAHDRTTLSVILIAASLICMGLSTLLFVGYKTIKHGTPVVTTVLGSISSLLGPVVHFLAHTSVIGPILSSIIRFFFFISFVTVLASDHVVRAVMRRFVGRHQTKRNFSAINAMDPEFTLFDPSIPPTRHLQDSELFKARKQSAADRLGGDKSWATLLQRPRYSLSRAYTLAVASKLVYEDVAVIKYELKKAGFDVDHTFCPIAYLVR